MTFNEIRALRAMGYSDAQIKLLAKSYKGKNVTLATGTTIDKPQIPGSAKILLGITASVQDVLIAPGQTAVTIKLNNEVIFDRVDVSNFASNYQGMANDQYTEVARKLNGSDVMEVVIEAITSGEFAYTIIYLS